MKIWRKYIVRAVLVFVSVWILLLSFALVYVRVNRTSIIASVKANIDKKISGIISFDDLKVNLLQNFPEVSIDVRNIIIRDSLYDQHKKDLLRAEHVYMGFGILDLLKGKKNPTYLTLTNSTIFLFTDSVNNKNWNIVRAQTQITQPFDINRITLKNVNAFFEDKEKHKFFHVWISKTKCRIENKNDELRFEINNKAVIENIFFNTSRGSYLTDKKCAGEWKVTFNKTLKTLSIKNQILKLDNHPYTISGEFVFKEHPRFHLVINTSDLLLNEAASLLPSRTARKILNYKLSKSLEHLQVELSGPIEYLSYPLVNIGFRINNASLDIYSTRFEHCSFDGFFKNEIDISKPKNDSNSVLTFTNIKGEWQKIAFESGNLTISNLRNPYMQCSIHSIFELSQIEKAIESSRLDFNSGKCEATLNYSGPLQKGADMPYDLAGNVTIRRADINYNPRNLNFKNTDIDIQFLKGNMLVKKMNTSVNDNRISINGTVIDFLTFFNTDPSRAIFDWNIYSPYVDLRKLSSFIRRNTSSKNKQGDSFLENLNKKIDRLFDACNAYLYVRADKVIYKNFAANNIAGRITLTNNLIRLDNFSLSHAGGAINFNASATENGNTNDLVLQSSVRNVDISELFHAFNNFGMESLTSKNISGSISAQIELSSVLDANNAISTAANKGYVDFSLKNGRIQNFKPLMEIDNKFLQKKDLNNVVFAELKDRLDLNGKEIFINRMEIRSTAVNMFLEGTYSFGSETDLSIQVPLKGQKNIKNMLPENKGIHSRTGMSVFIRAKDGKDGKLKFNYDPLGRFRDKTKL